MATSRLTWHAGSILPFASLWHTLMRVAALNSLRTREIPDADAQGEPGTWSTMHSRASLLYNESSNRQGEGISTRALARWLHEPVEAFEWSHLGRIPKGLRGIVHEGLRHCPECLAAGYHSALTSLRPLQTCPIHGRELLSRCHCGRAFEGRIDDKVLAHTLSCACGKWAYFTKQTCRRPVMTTSEISALTPVVHWLEAFVSVGHPQFGSSQKSAFAMECWLKDLRNWSDVLGIGYPSCFKAAPCPSRRRIVSTEGPQAMPTTAPLRAHSNRQGPADRRQEGHYWERNPATSAYRGMLRHLRRHVSRHSESYGIDFLRNQDPSRIAQVMRSNRHAMVAYAEMLWSRGMEPNVMRRRWPHRAVEQDVRGDFVGDIRPPFSARHAIVSPGQDESGRQWVEFQSCRSMMLSLWRDAQRRALEAVRAGHADWGVLSGEDAFQWATIHGPQSICFVSLESQPGWDWTLPLPDKARRRQEQLETTARRLRIAVDVCRGPCLTLSDVGEWHVADSISPSSGRVDQHRLLGVGHGKPRFWLFESGGQFVARVVDLKLQVLASSPREAIEALRRGLTQHQKVYPPAVAQPAPG